MSLTGSYKTYRDVRPILPHLMGISPFPTPFPPLTKGGKGWVRGDFAQPDSVFGECGRIAGIIF